MARKVVYLLSNAAVSDIDDIWEFACKRGAANAERLLDSIDAAIEFLVQNPGVGHRREDLTDLDVRFWNVKGYLVIFRPDTSPLQVVRILSGHRDIAAQLTRDK